jgi:hypothetical protein
MREGEQRVIAAAVRARPRRNMGRSPALPEAKRNRSHNTTASVSVRPSGIRVDAMATHGRARHFPLAPSPSGGPFSPQAALRRQSRRRGLQCSASPPASRTSDVTVCCVHSTSRRGGIGLRAAAGARRGGPPRFNLGLIGQHVSCSSNVLLLIQRRRLICCEIDTKLKPALYNCSPTRL